MSYAVLSNNGLIAEDLTEAAALEIAQEEANENDASCFILKTIREIEPEERRMSLDEHNGVTAGPDCPCSFGGNIPGYAQGAYFPGDEPGERCELTGDYCDRETCPEHGQGEEK